MNKGFKPTPTTLYIHFKSKTFPFYSLSHSHRNIKLSVKIQKKKNWSCFSFTIFASIQLNSIMLRAQLPRPGDEKKELPTISRPFDQRNKYISP